MTAEQNNAPVGAEARARAIHEARLATLGVVVSAVAHEINNPIAGILACVDALENGSIPEVQRAETFQTIRDALERMATTVQSLLTVGRRGGPALGAVDLQRVANACTTLLGPLTSRRRVTLVVALGAGEHGVRAREGDLTQALINLVGNAVRASEPGQTVRVETSRTEEGGLEILVIDQGQGMTPEVLARACDPFFTTREDDRGTGLGLYISRALVEGMDGTLTLRSEPGKGTLARIRLPGLG